MCSVFVLLFAATVVCSAQDDVSGDPLFLTPLLEQNNVAEAQRLSIVTPDIGNTISYSGYFTVNKTCGSNLFFWFFPAQKNWTQAPVILWLQGGPGLSFLWGLLLEVGPLTYNDQIGTRQYSWNVENNLLFIDQPVGTGYSFTENDCYPRNGEDVGRDLYSGVIQFFQLFPELWSNKFHIAGQSYAGHYIPALGYTIHKNNPTANIKINLAGMMIGSGWMDEVHQVDRSNYLYQHGLVDNEGNDMYRESSNRAIALITNKEYEKARDLERSMLGGDYVKFVGSISVDNYLEERREILSIAPNSDFIQLPQTRKTLHVGNINYTMFSLIVHNNLYGGDSFTPVKPWVEELLEHYPMVFFTGQLDIICAYPMVVNFLKALNWSGKSQFRSAGRQKWCVGDLQVGYYKGGHNLYDVIVRKAGHSVPFYQPFWSYILANSVTSGSPADPLHGLTPCQ